ncbi:unnamed protein product [Cuscuta epithymum]|uniref:PsbP C-terminal domain-containing protein n=1 Tax=Cuscuta epithymum TaxID=186058 RepID=A0AAV0E4U0_9ASTE|nr:unnamed protein product [Cuscuta epithymum]CAH9148556.1 unnamed protein product [Cuscuta epithymum]
MSVSGYWRALSGSQFPPLKSRRGGSSLVHRPGLIYSLISCPSTEETQNTTPVSVNQLPPIVLSRRRLLARTILSASLLPNSSGAIEGGREVLELERYTDPKDGFTLLRPSSWIKVDKAGATVLFVEDANKGSNNVGVVVSPVRITSLRQFGSPQFVAQKLIQAELRKESTKEAEVIGVSERSGKGGMEVYEFEYKVDSSRGGMKRVLSAAFISSNKLYLLNISHSDGLENPLGPDKRKLLEEVLHSFNMDQH